MSESKKIFFTGTIPTEWITTKRALLEAFRANNCESIIDGTEEDPSEEMYEIPKPIPPMTKATRATEPAKKSNKRKAKNEEAAEVEEDVATELLESISSHETADYYRSLADYKRLCEITRSRVKDYCDKKSKAFKVISESIGRVQSRRESRIQRSRPTCHLRQTLRTLWLRPEERSLANPSDDHASKIRS